MQRTPSRRPSKDRPIPIASGRQVTPARSNKNSLPDIVNALLVLDIHEQVPLAKIESEDHYKRKDSTLRSHWQFKKFSSKRIYHRFYYLNTLRFQHNKTEWKQLVNWALNYSKDHPEEFNENESKSPMTSKSSFDVVQ